jgi:hypothetical protein
VTDFTNTELSALATALQTPAAYAAVFTADPGLTGTVVGEVSGGSPAYARQAITWGSPTNGVMTATVTFHIPASTTITYGGVCSAVSGSNLVGRHALNASFSTGGSQVDYTMTLTATVA